MTVADKLSLGFASILSKAGTQISVRYYDVVYDTVYDEQTSLVLSGTLWTSGVNMPINSRRGSEDSVLLEQGNVQSKDRKLYVNGSLDMTGPDQVIKVQIGSPTGDIYTTIPLGGIVYEVTGTDIYKRQYLTLLNTGSF